MDGTGISKDVQGKAMQRGYDKWLDAVNTYTPPVPSCSTAPDSSRVR